MRLSELTDTTADAVRSAGSYLSDLATPKLRLGVTGLSRAGKTVFITALVHALCEGRANPRMPIGHLPGFRAFLEPQPDDDIPRFGYEAHLAQLQSATPVWPEGTRQISQLRLTLEWDATDWARQTAGINRALHVDIVDYPGEWLLDLGLLERSFADWSQEMSAFAERRDRDQHVEAWLQFAGSHAGDDPADEQVAIEGARAFRAFLEAVRRNERFARLISPGRFLLPGDLDGSPLLTFFPLRNGSGEASRPGTLGHMLERRFESYKTQVVRPFFERHFKSLDRQIVLVDVLSTLNGGPDAIEELERCLLGALQAFRPGRQSWLGGLLGRRIDRVLFAATKADHIHASNHKRLCSVLDALLSRALKRNRDSGAELASLAIASLRATEDVDYGKADATMPCIRGRPLAGEKIADRRLDGRTSAVVFPGDLPRDPLDIFDRDALAAGELNFVRFGPPPISDGDRSSPPTWPHIGLDDAVRFLLGDRLT